MLFEYLKYLITDRTVAKLYFSYFFYQRCKHDIHNYIVTYKMESSMWNKFTNQNYVSVIDNKYLFNLYFSAYNINVVKLLSHIDNNSAIINGKHIMLRSSNDLENLLKEMLEHQSKTHTVFVKRSEGTSGGSSVYKFSLNHLHSQKNIISNLFNETKRNCFIIEEAIIQHDEMMRLNPCCVNTVRIITFMDKNSNIEIISAFQRFGVKETHVDNVSSGGGMIGINLSSGRLNSTGYTDISHGKAQTFTKHPNTNVVFENFKIPYFKSAKELVLKAARYIPQLRLIGWDVAIGKDGPLLIEGNQRPGIRPAEIVYGGFKNNLVFMKAYEELIADMAYN